LSTSERKFRLCYFVADQNDIGTEGAADAATPSYTEARFARFYEETYATLWRLARRVCGDEEDAADVCQQAYVAVYGYWSRGELREEPRHLLFRVAKLRAIDALRSSHRRTRLLGVLPIGPSVDPTAVNTVEIALAELPRKDASLLLLQAVAGLTYEELARIEQQSVAAVKSRLYRIRRELAKRHRALKASP
jgi:RNA polymerase sigma-70 factor (ECF subfamily)